MKIKRTVTKEMHLGELITYIFENDITDKEFDVIDGEGGGHLLGVDVFGVIYASDSYCDKSILFEVETTEEIEVTEETELPFVVMGYHKKYQRFDAATFTRFSVAEIKESHDTDFIYLQNPDGSIGELIWSKEGGLR